MTNNYVIAGMATISNREDSMIDAALSIVNQVDHLHIYLNDYKDIPDVKTDRITFHNAPVGDLGDSGKFYGKQYPHESYFSIDDDLIYPSDYVEVTLNHLKVYPIISYHGRVMKPALIQTYYGNGLQQSYHMGSNIDNFYPVHIGGTGVMAQRKNNFSYLDCKEPNMSDIWFGLYAQYNKMPIVVAPHSKEWIQLTDKINHSKDTICAQYRRNDKIQTDAFNSIIYHNPPY